MPTEIFLPRLTQTMDDGTIAEWLKAEGDAVAAGEPLLAVESDKSTVELEAPATGLVGRIDRVAGQTVGVGQTLGWILGDGESLADLPAVEAPPAESEPAEAAASVSAQPKTTAPMTGAAGQATPVARRLATEHGLDLGAIAGTGPGGRVSKDDVLAALDARRGPDVATARDGVIRTIPLSGMRGTIARRLSESVRASAPVALSVEVNLTRADADRRRHLEQASGGDEQRLTLTPIICWAAVQTLKGHTALNGWVDDEKVEVAGPVHLGFAVGLGAGLVVPVLRDADSLSPSALAEALVRLAERARGGRLAAAEASGSSFTISSLGGQGVDVFAPILNPPEIAILGIGRAVPRAVVEGHNVIPALTAHLTLVFDHRATDGEAGAAFLAELRDRLESGEIPI